jgi:hypothetical protein
MCMYVYYQLVQSLRGAWTLRPPTFRPLVTTTLTVRPQKVTIQKCSIQVTLRLPYVMVPDLMSTLLSLECLVTRNMTSNFFTLDGHIMSKFLLAKLGRNVTGSLDVPERCAGSLCTVKKPWISVPCALT